MNPKEIVSTVYYICATIGLIAVVGKLFYGWFVGDQIGKRFIVDMAENHLPYIYKELRTLHPHCPDHPHIAFLHMKDHK